MKRTMILLLIVLVLAVMVFASGCAVRYTRYDGKEGLNVGVGFPIPGDGYYGYHDPYPYYSAPPPLPPPRYYYRGRYPRWAPPRYAPPPPHWGWGW